MNYTNTPQLRGWLENGFAYLASMDVFQIDASEYMRHMAAVVGRPPEERTDAAAFRCLTFDKPVERQKPPKPQQILMQQDQILKAHASQVETQRILHEEHAVNIESIRFDTLQSSERVLDRIEATAADNVERFTGLHTHADFVVREISDRSADAADRARGIHAFDVEERRYYSRHAWIRFAITTALLIILILLFAIKGHAQNINPAIVVATCGTPPVPYPAAGQRAPNTVDVNGNQCAGVSVSATIATAGLAISVSTGASTAGVVVTPVAGMVSTGAPTYTTGTVRELSLDTAGALRVNAAVSVPGALSVSTTTGGNGGQVAVVGARSSGTAVTFGPVFVGGKDDAGNLEAIRTTVAGNVVVSLETTSGVIGILGANSGVDVGDVTINNTAGAPVIASIQTNGVGVGVITATNALKSDLSSIAGTATTTGAGVSGTGTQRVSVANDSFTAGSPAIVSIQSNGTGVSVGAIAAVMSTSGALVTNSVEYGVYSTTTRALTTGQVAAVTITSSGATAVTPTGYTTAVAWGSSVNLAVTNSALVTVGAGLRIVLHRANFTCSSAVSVAVTASLGFGASTLPASGAGLIWAGIVTSASSFQGLQDGVGWPNVIGTGADGEDLRLTITVPTGGSCQVSLTYSTETTS